MSVVSIMSSGRGNKISCGGFGKIEFIPTTQKPAQIMKSLTYDRNFRLWRGSIPLALKDMKVMHRNCDLIDWDLASEFV